MPCTQWLVDTNTRACHAQHRNSAPQLWLRAPGEYESRRVEYRDDTEHGREAKGGEVPQQGERQQPRQSHLRVANRQWSVVKSKGHL